MPNFKPKRRRRRAIGRANWLVKWLLRKMKEHKAIIKKARAEADCTIIKPAPRMYVAYPKPSKRR